MSKLLGLAGLWLGMVVAAAAEEPLAWLDRDGVRAAYNYAGTPVEAKIDQLQRVGINTVILKSTVEKALPWAREAKQRGLKAFFACNFNVNAAQAGLRPAVLASGLTEAYVCPLDERFWREHLTPTVMRAVRYSTDPELEVTGLWIDFELYSTTTGQRYYTNACYCDSCFDRLCRHKSVETPKLAPDQRAGWLKEQGWQDEYQPFLQTVIESLAGELRQAVHAVNPNFLVGFYPTPHNWSLIGVARALSTPELPILLWATDTYGGGGAGRVPDDWREHYAKLGINARYLAGLLLRCYSARNLATHLYQATAKCDGYWLFTTFILEEWPRQPGELYHLASGTADEYWQAIAAANREMDQRLKDPGYRSALKLGPEPVVVPALKQPETRERVLKLIPPSAAGPFAYPEVKLRGGNLLVAAAQAGQEAVIRYRVHPVGPAKDPAAWSVITPDGEELAAGSSDFGQAGEIRYRATSDQPQIVVLAAGACAYSLTDSTVPVALFAGADLHTFTGAAKLYFTVPAGVATFAVRGKGSSARETIRIEVAGPDGQAATCQSTAKKLETAVTVEVAQGGGKTWSLSIVKADEGILEDNTISLPAPLPPVLALTPETAFGSR